MSLALRLRTLKVRRGKRRETVKVYEGVTPDRVRVFFLKHALFNKADKIYDKRTGAARFSFFGRAVVEFCKTFPQNYDMLHCMGWTTGLIPLYLDAFGGDSLEDTLTIFDPGALRYQGSFLPEDFSTLALPAKLFTDKALKHNERLNFSKAGILFSDVILTSSPSLADNLASGKMKHDLSEDFQEREEDIFGVLHGVEVKDWDPSTDPHLPLQYDSEHLNGKRRNKSELQHIFGLPQRPMVPLFGFFAPMVKDQGIKLVTKALETLLEEEEEIQCIFMGQGDDDYMKALTKLQKRFPKALGLHFSHDEALLHRSMAGVDMILAADPTGQDATVALRGMCYGTVPLFFRQGALKDAFKDWDGEGKPPKNKGAGVSFSVWDDEDLTAAMEEAIIRYRRPRRWRPMMEHCMAQDFSWDRSARLTAELYQELLEEFEEDEDADA